MQTKNVKQHREYGNILERPYRNCYIGEQEEREKVWMEEMY